MGAAKPVPVDLHLGGVPMAADAAFCLGADSAYAR
jgi:hypothetical protein